MPSTKSHEVTVEIPQTVTFYEAACCLAGTVGVSSVLATLGRSEPEPRPSTSHQQANASLVLNNSITNHELIVVMKPKADNEVEKNWPQQVVNYVDRTRATAVGFDSAVLHTPGA